MAIFDFLRSDKGANDSVNNQAQNFANSQIFDKLKVETLNRTIADVKLWRDSIEAFEDVDAPDRAEMQQLYAEIELDDQISVHRNITQLKISAAPFAIGKQNKESFEEDQEKTAIFKKAWFDKFIQQALNCELKGYGITEVVKPEGDAIYKPQNLVEIPKGLLIPEWDKIRTEEGGNTYLDIETYRGRIIEMGDKEAKGLYNNLALNYIYKKNALAFWSNFQSKFGIPPVIAKTDLTNIQNTNALVGFLKDMRANTFAVAGLDDEIEVLNVTNRDAYSTFKEMIKICNEQISKLMEGQTMTSSDGSSRSQAEVHERTAGSMLYGRMVYIERYINEQLIPILIQDGFLSEGDEFKFSESKNIDLFIDRAVKLSQAGYKIEKEVVEKETGLTIAEVQEVAEDTPQSVINAIEELYPNENDDPNKCC